MSAAGARLRLFVALDLPEVARAALVAWGAEAVAADAGLRAVGPDALHATLCFLGWRDEAEVGEIATLALGAAGPLPDLALGAAQWLPRRRPRALAIELDDRAGGLAALQAGVVGALQAAGLARPERRPYLGHVTVARVRGGGEPRGPRRREAAPPPAPVRFAGAALTLYRSRLAPAGARYEALARRSL